jgi:hypothetical protein
LGDPESRRDSDSREAAGAVGRGPADDDCCRGSDLAGALLLCWLFLELGCEGVERCVGGGEYEGEEDGAGEYEGAEDCDDDEYEPDDEDDPEDEDDDDESRLFN